MNFRPSHPRLLITESTWPELRNKGEQSPTFKRLLAKLERDARALLSAPPLVHEVTGFRMLTVSRTAIKRILLWAFNYHVTGDEVFKIRAEQEMLNISAFVDWGPEHFLDVGEFATAVALGYDWLYDELSPETRATIRTAIVEKGLKPGLDPQASHNWWFTHEMNWNQVCLGGMALGALAVAEDEPQLAEKILDLVRTYIPYGLKAYAPDGIYPEGPGYWGYGTTFQVVLLAALESALGTDWGLGQSPGFLATAEYPMLVTGPTRRVYNYSDGSELGHLDPALFWFARKFNDPEILYFQHDLVTQYLADDKPLNPVTGTTRFFPLLAIWAADLEAPSPPKRPLVRYGNGVAPLVVMRTSWTDSDALYLALKGGTASANHAHMDAGSFILEAEGVRWALDLRNQDYESLEAKGISLWNKAQDSGRWTVFRLNNFSHNTLTINGQLHRVEGRAEITRFSDKGAAPFAVVDLTQIFSGQADKVVRGFKLLPHRQVLIQDELSGLKPGDVVRWTFVTGAEVTVDGRHAVLQQNGKTLRISLAAPANGAFEVVPADPSADGFNAPNPGVSILRAHLKAPESGQLLIQVLIQPGDKSLSDQILITEPCENW